jgi:hypothetical protein
MLSTSHQNKLKGLKKNGKKLPTKTPKEFKQSEHDFSNPLVS